MLSPFSRIRPPHWWKIRNIKHAQIETKGYKGKFWLKEEWKESHARACYFKYSIPSATCITCLSERPMARRVFFFTMISCHWNSRNNFVWSNSVTNIWHSYPVLSIIDDEVHVPNEMTEASQTLLKKAGPHSWIASSWSNRRHSSKPRILPSIRRSACSCSQTCCRFGRGCITFESLSFRNVSIKAAPVPAIDSEGI